jgi:hypothetical protein
LSDPNYGYDDEEHNGNLNVGDHLAYRIEVLGILGTAARTIRFDISRAICGE